VIAGKEQAVDPIERYLKEVVEMVDALPREKIWQVVQAIQETRDRNGQVFILGNGGSAALASHMATDLAKTSIVPGVRRIRAISLADNVSLITAWANDTSYEDVFAEQLTNLLQSGDLVIAVSGSGNSPNVLRAVKAAKARGARTVGFTGRPGGKLKNNVDISIVVPSRRIEQAEDAHLILDHVISVALREAEMVAMAASGDGGTRKRG
jgi:D-sedoheptulose 7-phosphate isomerase